MKPVKYFQIVSFDKEGVMKPLEVNQFGHSSGLFDSENEAEQFINEEFLDSQEIGSYPPIDKVDLVISVIPIYLVRFK